MKKKKPDNPMKQIRKKVAPPGFSFKDKKKYNRKKKHRKMGW